MKCSSCGRDLPEGSRFCSGCGKLQQLAQEAAQQPAARPTSTDQMRPWWVVFGIILFISLFIPVGIIDGNLMMFWGLFEASARTAAWYIVNAVLGLTIFIISLIFCRGIARGSVMGGAGLAGFILYLALFAVLRGTDYIFIVLGMVCVAMMLGGCLIRKELPNSLTAKLVAGISGGLEIIFFVIGIILMLISTSGSWTEIIGNILATLVLILGIVPGILCLILIGNSPSMQNLLKATKTLIAVFLICFISLGLVLVILSGLRETTPIVTLLINALNAIVHFTLVVIYTLLLGVGFAEILKEAIIPTVDSGQH